MIAPCLVQILEEFSAMFKKKDSSKSKHHELQTKKPNRILSNMEKLTSMFMEYGVGSETVETSLHNIFTKKVVDVNMSSDILNRDNLGQELADNFTQERLTDGVKNVWDRLNRARISTFSCNLARVNIEKNAIGVIKEDRKLLQTFLIAARSLPDLDLKSTISKFEFSVAPRSLFASDGTLLMAKDEHKILSLLETESNKVDAVEYILGGAEIIRKIWIVNGMEKIFSFLKCKTAKNCYELCRKFIDHLNTAMTSFDGLRIIFDRYHENYFQSTIETSTASTAEVIGTYIISDQTDVTKINSCAHRSTKQQLAEYIATKIVSHCKSELNNLKDVLASWDTFTDGNVNISTDLQGYCQEEAELITILHISQLKKTDHVTIDSQQIVVLLLLLHFYESLPEKITYRSVIATLRREFDVKRTYSALGTTKVEALLGYFALTGTYKNGGFSGKSKESTFKMFLKCPDDILKGLKTMGDQLIDIEDVCTAVIPFICYLYKSPHRNIENTRWYLFCNQAPPEDMPPTETALKLHISRAHYIATIWKNALNPSFKQLDPNNFGWKKDDFGFSPIYNTFQPAPDCVLNVIKCKCKKGCKTLACSCRKNRRFCTEMCGCCKHEDCTNAHDFGKPDINSEDSEDD